MFIRACYRKKNGKRHAYWALVESFRTARGPRQRIVSYLGQIDAKGRLGVEHAAKGNLNKYQADMFDNTEPEWVEVDASRIRVENNRTFGSLWLGMCMIRQLGLDEFLKQNIGSGREEIPWHMMSLVLILSRLCEPSSELHIAEHYYRQSAMSDLLGISEEKVNQQRLYRSLDALLPHKEKLEKFLKDSMGTLFKLEYDLLLYDVTSTYFEGECNLNLKAQRGYSRDKRGDCKQVCIGLVVTKEGMPLGYEVFAGNRQDVTTIEDIVKTMEKRYGRANRVWCLDRGMISEDNIEFLKEQGQSYIVGTPRKMLKKFENDLLNEDWEEVHEGLEVKRCPGPDGEETFILCRSRDRQKKEQGIHARFEARIEEGLEKITKSCIKRKQKPRVIERRIGRLLQRNTRAAGLFDIQVQGDEDSGARLKWKKIKKWRDWASLSEGCYLLRSNIKDWSAEDLWKAYIQLTDAEEAFRIQKSDLRIRPIWHQREDRVDAHILVCFLAYVLWKTLARRCKLAGLGDEPRKVLRELEKIQVVDVVLPTRKGMKIRKRCVTRPTKHQEILLQHLGLKLPEYLKICKM